MKWIIKNPAPWDSRLHKWGDYHFGRLLVKHLRRRGEDAETHYHPHWDRDGDCDVVLVLRGKHPFERRARQHAGAVQLLWNISHPGDVSDAECQSYDLIAMASLPRARELDARLSTPVVTLLQCTDPEELAAGEPAEADERTRRGFVFVGNTRVVLRPGVLWAIEYGLPLRIWGRGWERWHQTRRRVVADYYPNEHLGRLYTRSRATINDHWDDMKAYGFINNRVLDALACGLPVVSDWHGELTRLFPDEIAYYRDRLEFGACMDRLLLNYPGMQDRVRSARTRVREEYTFDQRARELLDLVAGVQRSR
jgi:glycosyltransferase involved in cell wall biosynthesis